MYFTCFPHKVCTNALLTSCVDKLIVAPVKKNILDDMCQIDTEVNHEVRTALNAIMGFAQILNLEENTKEEVHTYDGIIWQQSENQLAIINDIINKSV